MLLCRYVVDVVITVHVTIVLIMQCGPTVEWSEPVLATARQYAPVQHHGLVFRYARVQMGTYLAIGNACHVPANFLWAAVESYLIRCAPAPSGLEINISAPMFA